MPVCMFVCADMRLSMTKNQTRHTTTQSRCRMRLAGRGKNPPPPPQRRQRSDKCLTFDPALTGAHISQLYVAHCHALPVSQSARLAGDSGLRGAESQRVSVSSQSCGVGQRQVSAVVFGWPGQSGAVTSVGGGARSATTPGQDRYTFLAIATGWYRSVYIAVDRYRPLSLVHIATDRCKSRKTATNLRSRLPTGHYKQLLKHSQFGSH